MTPINIQHAINWLKKQPTKSEFTYANQGCGCLFTKMIFNYKDEDAANLHSNDNPVVCVGGTLSNNKIGTSVVPFHDEFWKKVRDNTDSQMEAFNVSKSKAIKILKEIQEEGKFN